MAKIKSIKGRQVFDSRGNPTVEAEIILEDGHHASAIVPSGASTGTHEAFELRDNKNKDYLGKSVFSAVKNIDSIITKSLKNVEINDQAKIDNILIDLDGTENKKKLGGDDEFEKVKTLSHKYWVFQEADMYQLDDTFEIQNDNIRFLFDKIKSFLLR